MGCKDRNRIPVSYRRKRKPSRDHLVTHDACLSADSAMKFEENLYSSVYRRNIGQTHVAISIGAIARAVLF